MTSDLFAYVLSEGNGSILAMAMLHGSLTASLPLILAPPATGMPLFHFYAIFGLVLLLAVLAMELANSHAKVPSSAMTLHRNRIYAALLMTGASVLVYRAVSMIANASLTTLVPWVAGLILLELCLDAACFLVAVPWLLSGDSMRGVIPLRIGVLCTIVHAIRVVTFVLGRLDTPWKDFDVRDGHRKVHGERWNWPQVCFAGFASSASVSAVVLATVVFQRPRPRHDGERDERK